MNGSTGERDKASKPSDLFREFPELDRILKDGIRRGRSGVQAAVLRVLSLTNESGENLTPAVVWRRLRHLRDGSAVAPAQRSLATAEDEALLRQGYTKDDRSKRNAIAEVLKRHPDWPRRHVWTLAKTLGLVSAGHDVLKRSKRPSWSDRDVQRLLNRAGCDPVEMIAAALQRPPEGVRCKLAGLGKRAKVSETYSRRWVADALHIGFRAVNELLQQELLRMRKPNVAASALRAFLADHAESLGLQLEESALSQIAKSNERRTQKKIAEMLAVSEEQVRHWVIRGLLPPVDDRITEESLEEYCQTHADQLNHTFMDRDQRDWLAEMAGVENWGAASKSPSVPSARKHACIVRTCLGCRLKIRGNVYFRHIKVCPGLGMGPRTPPVIPRTLMPPDASC
jgi:hypothetical protein